MTASSFASALTRRKFIQSAAAVAAYSAAPFARASRVPAHERITIGVIGWGMMGPSNTKSFLGYDDCQVVAACDIEKNHLQQAVDTVNNKYGNKDCAAFHDYRELLARDDIDAIMIAIPDHWHAIVATEAAARKKDIRREASRSHHRRTAGNRPCRPPEQHHLADGLLAALRTSVPQSR